MLLPYLDPELTEAGCDEAGRGCLAGAVYAAAVILPKDYKNELLNDSKKLSEKKRYQLREIIQRDALAWAVGVVTPAEIDEINILNASFLAMHRAIDQLTIRPQALKRHEVVVEIHVYVKHQKLRQRIKEHTGQKNRLCDLLFALFQAFLRLCGIHTHTLAAI